MEFSEFLRFCSLTSKNSDNKHRYSNPMQSMGLTLQFVPSWSQLMQDLCFGKDIYPRSLKKGKAVFCLFGEGACHVDKECVNLTRMCLMFRIFLAFSNID